MFQTCVLTALFATAYCAAVVPTINDNWFNNDYPDLNTDLPNTDLTDSSAFVEPTVPSSEGEVMTNSFTPVDNILTDNDVGRSKPQAKSETPQEVSNWLQALRDLENKKHVMGTRTRDGNVEVTTESIQGISGDDIELPSPDKFFKWLDSIPPLKKDTDKPDSGVGREDKLNTEPHHSAHELDFDIHNSKLILMICVPVGAVLLCLILLTVYIVYKKRLAEKKAAETKLSGLGVANRNPDVFNVEGKDNVFMGIPTNNQIWKELQMLPATASSVLPES